MSNSIQEALQDMESWRKKFERKLEAGLHNLGYDKLMRSSTSSSLEPESPSKSAEQNPLMRTSTLAGLHEDPAQAKQAIPVAGGLDKSSSGGGVGPPSPKATEPSPPPRPTIDTSQFAKVEDIKEIQKSMAELREYLEGCEQQDRFLEKRLESETSLLKESDERLDELMRVSRRNHDAVAAKVHSHASELVQQSKKAQTFTRELAEIVRQKADVTTCTAIQAAVTDLSTAWPEEIAHLREHISKIEQSVRECENSVHRVNDEVKHVQEGVDTHHQEVKTNVKVVEDLCRNSENSIQQKMRPLEVRIGGTIERSLGLESRLEELTALVKSMAGKADQTDVIALRSSISAMAQDIKDREQAVLFGAKCLSCNRVFDDVQPTAGVVNLPAEKQRAKLFAEVQRAFHSPGSDPAQAIKMLTVKVGRPGSLPRGSGAGPFEGRDSASLACGVEDVTMIPVWKHPIANEGGHDGTHYTKTEAPVSPTIIPGHKRPATTPARMLAGNNTPQRRWKSSGTQDSKMPPAIVSNKGSDGFADFKHPLSDIIGRS